MRPRCLVFSDSEPSSRKEAKYEKLSKKELNSAALNSFQTGMIEKLLSDRPIIEIRVLRCLLGQSHPLHSRNIASQSDNLCHNPNYHLYYRSLDHRLFLF